MNSMILDIDDGFCFKEPDACTDNMRVIRRELQKFFSIWKDNNYQGMLFDQSMGLDFTNDVPASLPEPKPSTLLFAHEYSITSVYPSARAERDYHLTTYIASGNTLFHFPPPDSDDTIDNIKMIYRGQG